MPSNLINAYSIKLKRPIKELEKKWEEAKQKAVDAGKKESDKKFYAYVVTVFQHLLGINDKDVIPLELHKIDNNKAFKVTEGVIPSFRDFISESLLVNENEEFKKDTKLCNDFLAKLKAFVAKEGFEIEDDFEKSFIISYKTNADQKHNAPTKRFIKCAIDLNYGW